MYRRKKGRSKKVYLAILLLVVIVVATAAIVYTTQFAAKKVEVGVHVGDVFMYSLKGTSALGLDATDDPGFDQYNATDYFKVTVSNVIGTTVTLNSVWRFLNGTEITSIQLIDLANGNKTDKYGFWALYPANLNVGDLLRPTGFDSQIVNKTETKSYADSVRYENFWSIEGEFQYALDPTQSTFMYDIRNIYFDKETGILTSLVDYQQFNNPQKVQVITWTLTNSSLWNVK